MANHLTSPQLQALAELLLRDPTGRRTAPLWQAAGVLPADALAACIASFRPPLSMALVTGFCIVDADPPCAETDGPPGTLFLASILRALGAQVALVCDDMSRQALEAGSEFLQLPNDRLHVCPSGPAQFVERWATEFVADGRYSHLIAVERPGPSHTLASASQGDAALAAEFAAAVPPDDCDRCHNMRGRDISEYTAPAHRLFELAQQSGRRITTIGIGDGGNEIGFGAVPWIQLRDALGSEVGARIACRVPADHLLIAGTSDWGAYVLGVALAAAAGRHDLITPAVVDRQRDLLRHLVKTTSIVDGVTRRREATVDGLPLEEYLGLLREAVECVACD
ncbi:MAG: DUF4392 domain-containing protein [Pirellulales bacterium]|nr:DUF4392 domain-containing protein [Pirellulales bacterium]